MGDIPRDNSSILHLHLSLFREGRCCTTDDFKTSFLHFSLFSIALWDNTNVLKKKKKKEKAGKQFQDQVQQLACITHGVAVLESAGKRRIQGGIRRAASHGFAATPLLHDAARHLAQAS